MAIIQPTSALASKASLKVPEKVAKIARWAPKWTNVLSAASQTRTVASDHLGLLKRLY